MIDLGLAVAGEQAVYQKLFPFGQRWSVGDERALAGVGELEQKRPRKAERADDSSVREGRNRTQH